MAGKASPKSTPIEMIIAVYHLSSKVTIGLLLVAVVRQLRQGAEIRAVLGTDPEHNLSSESTY